MEKGQYAFSFVAISLQIVMIILFGFFVRYDKKAVPDTDNTSTTGNTLSTTKGSHSQEARAEVAEFYPFFQDIHVMIFIGFGFLMTFLKRYGFGSVSLNLLVAALVLQWATLTNGWILHPDEDTYYIYVGMERLIEAEFAAAAVLISFGAVLGKVSALQLLVMAIIEIVVFQVNEYVVFHIFHASDIGDSMVVHAFGAYFGLMVARCVFTEDVHKAESKESSVYHSDIFAMIGTVFLWMFWPSFNSATAIGQGQYRAVINTYFSLTSCAVTTFAISAFVNKEKFSMVHIQNASLAGGVAVGTMADMIIEPWGALLIGMLAAILSVIGYRFVTPFLSHKLKIHDTCGVNNLHGMPAIMSGLGGIVCAALATKELYGDGLKDQFKEMVRESPRSAGEQAGFQAAALGASIGIASAAGLITGLILRIPIWGQPAGRQIFDDGSYFLLPDDGFPSDGKEPDNVHQMAENGHGTATV